MYYLINDVGNTIQVPDWQRIYYKDLTLIGKKTTDWNEPIQENFLKIVDRIERLETLLAIPDTITSSNLGLFNLTDSPQINTFTDTQTVIDISSNLGLFNLTDSPQIATFIDSQLVINKSSNLGLFNLYDSPKSVTFVNTEENINTSSNLGLFNLTNNSKVITFVNTEENINTFSNLGLFNLVDSLVA